MFGQSNRGNPNLVAPPGLLGTNTQTASSNINYVDLFGAPNMVAPRGPSSLFNLNQASVRESGNGNDQAGITNQTNNQIGTSSGGLFSRSTPSPNQSVSPIISPNEASISSSGSFPGSSLFGGLIGTATSLFGNNRTSVQEGIPNQTNNQIGSLSGGLPSGSAPSPNQPNNPNLNTNQTVRPTNQRPELFSGSGSINPLAPGSSGANSNQLLFLPTVNSGLFNVNTNLPGNPPGGSGLLNDNSNRPGSIINS